MSEKLTLDEVSSKIFAGIDEKIVASQLDDVNFMDLWRSILHSARHTDFREIQQRDTVADLVDLVAAFKEHSVPGNEKYNYLYSSLTDFDMACRASYNDAPVAHDGFYQLEVDAWANLNFFLARITGKDVADFSINAIWAMREALETVQQDDEDATAAQKYDAHVPAAAAWAQGSDRKLFLLEKDLTPTDPKQGNPARGGELWKGKSEFSPERWAFWKERFVAIGEMKEISEATQAIAKSAVEHMERAETFERIH